MKWKCLVLMTILSVALADIGEKLRLGQLVKATPQNNFNAGLQAPFSTSNFADNNAAATSNSEDENNLERLCNDPFHSFLCKLVGPRKNRIDGRLRAEAKLPSNVINGFGTNQQESRQPPLQTGGAILSAGIQASPSFDNLRISSSKNNNYLPPAAQVNVQPSATQQFITSKRRPSNQYLPTNSDPVQLPKDNVQLALPFEHPQQNVYRYTTPSVTTSNNFIQQSSKPPFNQQASLPRTTTISPFQTVFSSTTVQPSNTYKHPNDIRINPSNIHLPPFSGQSPFPKPITKPPSSPTIVQSVPSVPDKSFSNVRINPYSTNLSTFNKQTPFPRPTTISPFQTHFNKQTPFPRPTTISPFQTPFNKQTPFPRPTTISPFQTPFNKETPFPRPTTISPFQTPFNKQTSFTRPTTISPLQTSFYSTTVQPLPSNTYLPVKQPNDIRISPSSTNLSPYNGQYPFPRPINTVPIQPSISPTVIQSVPSDRYLHGKGTIDVRVNPSSSNLSPFNQQTPFPRPTTKSPFQPVFSTSTLQPAPSNAYLPVKDPLDIRVSPSSTNLSPLIRGGALLPQGIQASPTDNQPKKEEKQHTLEELCNDAFHSFLCKPITKPRKRIDGRIRPGAKIPPHVLQGADTSEFSSRRLPPLQKGSALLAEGIVDQNSPQGYLYQKPEIPFFSTQPTQQQPLQNQFFPQQEPFRNQIIPQQQTIRNQIIHQQQPIRNQIIPQQQPIRNQIIPQHQVTPDRVPDRVPPPSTLAQHQNIFSTYNQPSTQTIKQPIFPEVSKNEQIFLKTTTSAPFQPFQNQQYNIFSTTTKPFITTKSLAETKYPFPTASTTPRSNQLFEYNQLLIKNTGSIKSQNVNYMKSNVFNNQFPLAESAQISSTQTKPFNNPNIFTSQFANGYQYSTPKIPFTFPTTAKTPVNNPNLFYIPAFENGTTKLKESQNQIVTTTHRPFSTLKSISATQRYNYPKPSTEFTLPTETYKIPSATPTAISSRDQPVTVTTSKPFPLNNAGYLYPKPAQPFTLATSSSKFVLGEGYTYPRPDKPFTLPPRNVLPSQQEFGIKLHPIQTFNEQFNLPLNNVIGEQTKSEDSLPPASQFEILKP